jgi:penicillin-binding protein 1A
LRQPGSAFKLFVYLAAFEAGWSPDAQILDAPVTVGKWSPENYDGRYRGEVSLREAFALSLNTAAVRLSQAAGRDKVAAMAQRLGISTPLADDASIALGTSEVTLLELTGAYAALANGGRGAWPYGILEIRDAAGRVLFQHNEAATERLVDGQTLAKAADVLRAAVAWGTGKAAQLDRPVGGKTGTSQQFRDAWFVGYTSDLVTGVWFGNDDGTPMQKVAGGSLPARTWAAFMKPAEAGRPARPLPGSEIAILPSTPEQPAGDRADSLGGFIGRLLQDLKGGKSGGSGGVNPDNKTFAQPPNR